MNVLIIGSGGREYALGRKIAKSPLLENLYFLKGNGGCKKYGSIVDIEEDNIEKIVEFALEKEIDLTIVGPENPLSLGIVDEFQKNNLKIFGVDKYHSQFESSKEFTKNFLDKYDIPTAGYESFDSQEKALDYLRDLSYPTVIKADGLALGKGVFIVNDFEEAKTAIGEIFSEDGFGQNKVVIEDYLDGKEVSSICLVSNNKIVPLPFVRDFKKIGHGDTGENTGGIGCISPVDDLSEKELEQIQKITKQIQDGLEDGGYSYTGVLFIGYMITKDQTYVLEFNVRFGDPETEVLMEKIDSDLLAHLADTVDGRLDPSQIEINDNYYLGVVAVSEGYPRDYKKGFEISGLDLSDSLVIHNATLEKDGKYYTNGGRVLTVVASGSELESARQKAYEDLDKISFENMYFRKDIK